MLLNILGMCRSLQPLDLHSLKLRASLLTEPLLGFGHKAGMPLSTCDIRPRMGPSGSLGH